MSGELGENSLTIVLISTLVFGLLVGSFLNVVIYRLPQQLQLSWRHDALDFLGQKPEETDARKFGLVFPPSRCPHCEKPISPWQNIPVFSYLLLRGRCRSCAEPISIQYPLIELICGILSTYVIYQFGLTTAGILALIFTWLLIALTGIDLNHQLLPDSLTLLLLWLGLLANSAGIFIDPNSAIIGASAGYLTLWGIYWVFKLLTGKEGMGYGDFKLAAALGAWLGWQQLPLVLLLSSLVGAVIGTIMLLQQKKDSQTHIAYGPYLAIAGWIALVSGDKIMTTYLSTF